MDLVDGGAAVNRNLLLLGVVAAAVVIVAGQMLGWAQAQPASPIFAHMQKMPMTPQPGMPVGQMMQQMQGQMAEMTASIKALRGQLDKTNPELLTGQERPMYEYLKLLQTHLETMHGMLGTMMQMPGMRGR